MDKIQQLEKNIRDLKIQGATNIAIATLEGIKSAIESGITDPPKLQKMGEKLAYARPTEPLAQNAIRFVFLEKDKTISFYLKKAKEFEFMIQKAKVQMSDKGANLVESGGTYLTHCHSQTVVSMLVEAKNKGKNFAVIATETRPLFQGRITVKELLEAQLSNVTLVIDDVASSLILNQEKDIKAIFVGADLLSEKGFVNKVGTLAIAYAAKARNIPLFCFSVLLKYDPREYSSDLIEKREGSEIWKDAPRNLKIYAPAFDFIPYDTNIKIVCEKGIIDGMRVKEEALASYPFLSG